MSSRCPQYPLRLTVIHANWLLFDLDVVQALLLGLDGPLALMRLCRFGPFFRPLSSWTACTGTNPLTLADFGEKPSILSGRPHWPSMRTRQER